MVKHIIIWTLNPELTDEVKENRKQLIKKALEGLNGRIEGLIEMKVITDVLLSSNGDLMLDSTFESEAALINYSVNPTHLNIAHTTVRPYTVDRKCIDYTV